MTNRHINGFTKGGFDIVSIGDCTIDAFLKIHEATLHADIHHEHQQICFSFADKIPYDALYMLPAGNANNVAVGMSRLGFKTGYYGTVGGDQNGAMILDNLKKEKVDRRFISIQKKQVTNFHFVLWYKTERTILIKHQDFSYRLPKGIEKTKWIYFTSVGQKGLSLHASLMALLSKHPQIKLSFNPGTFQLRLGLAKLAALLRRTEILNVNKEEAELLVDNGKDLPIIKLAQALHKAGASIIIITDGLNGSYCYENGVLYKIGVYPHHPYEATGAGDAYATAFTAAIMSGLPVTEALRWGARNGASVATIIGPQKGLLTWSQIKRDLAKHPEFQPRIIGRG